MKAAEDTLLAAERNDMNGILEESFFIHLCGIISYIYELTAKEKTKKRSAVKPNRSKPDLSSSSKSLDSSYLTGECSNYQQDKVDDASSAASTSFQVLASLLHFIFLFIIFFFLFFLLLLV